MNPKFSRKPGVPQVDVDIFAHAWCGGSVTPRSGNRVPGSQQRYILRISMNVAFIFAHYITINFEKTHKNHSKESLVSRDLLSRYQLHDDIDGQRCFYVVKRWKKATIRCHQFHHEVHTLARFRGSSWVLSLVSAFYDATTFHIVTDMHVTSVARAIELCRLSEGSTPIHKFVTLWRRSWLSSMSLTLVGPSPKISSLRKSLSMQMGTQTPSGQMSHSPRMGLAFTGVPPLRMFTLLLRGRPLGHPCTGVSSMIPLGSK